MFIYIHVCIYIYMSGHSLPLSRYVVFDLHITSLRVCYAGWNPRFVDPSSHLGGRATQLGCTTSPINTARETRPWVAGMCHAWMTGLRVKLLKTRVASKKWSWCKAIVSCIASNSLFLSVSISLCLCFSLPLPLSLSLSLSLPSMWCLFVYPQYTWLFVHTYA